MDQQENKLKVNPHILFREINELIEEGFTVEDIRLAVDLFLEEKQHKVRKTKNAMKRTRESVPVPDQETINEMYESQVQQAKKLISNDPDLATLDIENMIAMALKNKGIVTFARNRKPTLRNRAYRVANFILKPLILGTIWVLKLFGFKDKKRKGSY